MASEKHGKYLIVAVADYDAHADAWLPYAQISWTDGKNLHYHQFKNVGKDFDLRNDAINYGLVIARAWIENQL